MIKTLECGHIYPNGSGRRKRCPDCAHKHRLQQIAKWCKDNYFYEKKRPTS